MEFDYKHQYMATSVQHRNTYEIHVHQGDQTLYCNILITSDNYRLWARIKELKSYYPEIIKKFNNEMELYGCR
jgi:hypothetical protein